MDPRQIAQLITENIKINNGLILEDQPTHGVIRLNNIKDPSNYPLITDDVAFPAYLKEFKRIEKAKLYVQLRIMGISGPIEWHGIAGGYYPEHKVVKPSLADVGSQGNAKLINIALSFSIVGVDFDLSEFINWAKRIRIEDGKITTERGLFNPEEWMKAVFNNIKPENIVKRMPRKIFPEDTYYGIKNDEMGYVLLSSGVLGEGLYVIPEIIKIEDKNLDWADAANMFGDNPGKYVKGEQIKPGATGRIRLLFRKFIQNTNQGVYIDRARLSADDTVKAFKNSTSLKEFLDNYKQATESLRIMRDGLELIREYDLGLKTILR